MSSFDETKAQMDALYGGKLEYRPFALDSLVNPRIPSRMEVAFTTMAPWTSLAAAAAGYTILAVRINRASTK